MNNQPIDPVEGLLSYADEAKRGAEQKRSDAAISRFRAGELLEQANSLEKEADEDEGCGKRHRLVAMLVRGVSPEWRRVMRQRRDGEPVGSAGECQHPLVLEYRFASRQCLVCQHMESSVNGSPFSSLGDSRERYVHQRWNLDGPAKPFSWPGLVAWLAIEDDKRVLKIFKDTGLTVALSEE